jgi:hypothetical protein
MNANKKAVPRRAAKFAEKVKFRMMANSNSSSGVFADSVWNDF